MNQRPTVMFYCQHVLGMGHFVRSMELVKGLKDFKVCFFNGGDVVPGFAMPPELDIVQLPALGSDAAFTGIRSQDAARPLAEIQGERVRALLDGYERLRPDILIVELFPFGRKQFAFELVPLLARVRRDGATKVVCSLRDILVSKRDQARHEERVCALMNRYFDLLLIHADPRFQRLEETFFRAESLETPARYTGYVAQTAVLDGAASEPDLLTGRSEEALLLVSVGGGRVGLDLLEAAVDASALLAPVLAHRMLVFTGPYLPPDDYQRLEARVAGRSEILLCRFTGKFLSYMEAADLSISLAGYNTCMNILSTGTRALVLPFTGGGNGEQTIRATKLAALGTVGLLESADLAPAVLARRIAEALGRAPAAAGLDTAGAANTAAALKELLETGRRVLPSRKPLPLRSGLGSTGGGALERKLGRGLDDAARADRVVEVFLRDDDADDDSDRLVRLMELTLGRDVPLNLEIIPAGLTETGTRRLDHYKRFCPALIELHQHGWRHVNHETAGKKCEFGPSRDAAAQREDIAAGKAKLERLFEERFTPVFTPPWNRCTGATLRVLRELGFLAVSRDRGAAPPAPAGLPEIAATLDLYRWRGGAKLRPPEAIVEALLEQMRGVAPVGILLHHKVMDREAYRLLDGLLALLRQSPAVRFPRFGELLQAGGAAA